MNGQVEAFAAARRFLADKSANGTGVQYARNVRKADIIAVTSQLTGNIAIGLQSAEYSGAGSYPGPLDSQGNMPRSSAGVIIGTAIVLPKPWVATEEPDDEQAYQSVAMSTTHIVAVAGTNVVGDHAAFGTVYPSIGETGIATGPLYGIPGPSAKFEREPQPLLWVGPGERVTQGLYVRRAIALGAVTVTPELVAQLVIADEGTD